MMAKALIKLAYRQVIDGSSKGIFEQRVFGASYEEFLLKSQAYNLERKFKTFSELKANDGRANSLHYKLSFAVGHFIAALNNRIPVLRDNAGQSLAFDVPRLELIESDITDRAAHQVAINYQTGLLMLLNTAGEYLVLATGEAAEDDEMETFTVKMRPELSVVFYKDLPVVEPAHINGKDTLVMYNIKD